ncbi:tRNA dihydrouridine(20/20a) synthase DusA [Bacterioplanoides pacificum]|uniref:tRNA-dihydrouridine(20/20a) synthase n=1 Tax=Bacterioplanoides pacificum TaxID=1171596 RepID=A0ABV7VTB9_9GAMM
MTAINRTFSTAPMMDWSDRHCRAFWRQLSKNALLYTEMVTTGALIHGQRERFLQYNDCEHPIALQLGGSDPQQLAQCAALAEQWGYDEVNLNVGCPSDRVQNNMIGACLMAHPQLVADCIKAMQDACDIEVTIKHRIGIDDLDSYEHMRDFVATVAATGCRSFTVHARKAILQGLSPKENRDIPPLQYDLVYRLKQEFPQLEIIINGGIKTHEDCQQHLQHLDGVMLGREAYQNPAVLMEVDQRYYTDTDTDTETALNGTSGAIVAGDCATQLSSKDKRIAAVRAFYPYIEQQLSQGATLNYITRHMLGLFNGLPGARQFRRHLSEQAFKKTSGIDVLEQALQRVE